MVRELSTTRAADGSLTTNTPGPASPSENTALMQEILKRRLQAALMGGGRQAVPRDRGGAGPMMQAAPKYTPTLGTSPVQKTQPRQVVAYDSAPAIGYMPLSLGRDYFTNYRYADQAVRPDQVLTKGKG